MNDKEDIFKRLYDSFMKGVGQLHVMERSVPIDRQLAYFRFSDSVRKNVGNLKEDDYERLMGDLKNDTSSKEEKKRILSLLPVSKQVKAYRLLESFVQETESKELSDWAYMALTESRISLEFELSGERQIYISSGLGGKGIKLRFYIVLLSSLSDSFLDYQKKIVRDELMFALPKREIEIERLTIENRYIEIVVLMPLIIHLKDVIKDIITECNQYGNFLRDTFIASNEKELGKKEIESALEEQRNN